MNGKAKTRNKAKTAITATIARITGIMQGDKSRCAAPVSRWNKCGCSEYSCTVFRLKSLGMSQRMVVSKKSLVIGEAEVHPKMKNSNDPYLEFLEKLSVFAGMLLTFAGLWSSVFRMNCFAVERIMSV